MPEIHLLLGIVSILLISNALVTFCVARSPFYERHQKRAQIFLIWGLPCLGTVLVGVFLWSQYGWQLFDTRAFPESNELGSDLNETAASLVESSAVNSAEASPAD